MAVMQPAQRWDSGATHPLGGSSLDQQRARARMGWGERPKISTLKSEKMIADMPHLLHRLRTTLHTLLHRQAARARCASRTFTQRTGGFRTTTAALSHGRLAAFPTAAIVLAASTTIPFAVTPLECSPTYHGVPVAATFLMHQALPVFDKTFPGLEMSPVFVMGHPEYSYAETGLLSSVWATGATMELPIFERLSEEEEAKLGSSGIRKKPVGRLLLVGECEYGCAAVRLREMKVFKANGELLWEKKMGK
ncbi:hypothetical protein HDU67_000786 [Dinochytrium kinnereticum]|nr:hypothetical protein HDU67_000786 [Dinochytrium kinnereticum]